MFASRRRGFGFPRMFIFVAGAAVALAVVGAGSAASLLVLPFLFFKMMFFFFMFATMARFFGGGRSGHLGGPSRGRRSDSRPEPTQDDVDRAKAEREARDEIDALFPDPRA